MFDNNKLDGLLSISWYFSRFVKNFTISGNLPMNERFSPVCGVRPIIAWTCERDLRDAALLIRAGAVSANNARSHYNNTSGPLIIFMVPVFKNERTDELCRVGFALRTEWKMADYFQPPHYLPSFTPCDFCNLPRFNIIFAAVAKKSR